MLKRQNSDLNSNKVSKKQRTEESSKINSSKKDADEILNFLKSSCTQITVNSTDSYDTIGVDDIMNIVKNDHSQDTVIQQNGQKELFVSASDKMNHTEDIKGKPSNEILPDVVNGVRTEIKNAQNEKERDEEASNRAVGIIKIDEASSWLKQTSCNSTKGSLKNLADETGAEPCCGDRVPSSLSLNESTKLEDHEILPTGSMMTEKENAELSLIRERMILSWSLNEISKPDCEILSTEPMARDPDVSGHLLEDVSQRDTFPWSTNELTKNENHEFLRSVPIVKDPGNSADFLGAEISNDSIYFSSSLRMDLIDESDKNTSIEHDLVPDLLERKLLNKVVQLCTRNDLSDEIGTPKIVELNEVSNNFKKDPVQQEYSIFHNLPDLQKNSNISISENFSDNNPLQKYRNKENMTEEIPSQSHLCFFGLNEENIKCKENNEKSTTFLKQTQDTAYDSIKDPVTFPQQCGETSSTNHSSCRSNLNEHSVKRSLVMPFTLGSKCPRYSSKPSTSIQRSKLIQEGILVFLETQGQQIFTIQEIVNFIMDEFDFEQHLYFDAIHSTRIFLRNALDAEMLKMHDGKYVLKSSVVEIP